VLEIGTLGSTARQAMAVMQALPDEQRRIDSGETMAMTLYCKNRTFSFYGLTRNQSCIRSMTSSVI
jgi:hypothetical protein